MVNVVNTDFTKKYVGIAMDIIMTLQPVAESVACHLSCTMTHAYSCKCNQQPYRKEGSYYHHHQCICTIFVSLSFSHANAQVQEFTQTHLFSSFIRLKSQLCDQSKAIIPRYAMPKLLSPKCYFISTNPKQCTTSTLINNINE